MAHLRARIQSKGGETTRLGNKRDGMRVEINGNGWRVVAVVSYNPMTRTDTVIISRVHQDNNMMIGDCMTLVIPVEEGKR